MALLKDIQGQSSAVRYLSGSISSGRIASSYLFSGPEGVGRALAAKAFLKELMCTAHPAEGACGTCPTCRRIDSGVHPDLAWIKPEKNKSIKIAEIRKVREVLSLKPFEAPVNACCIEDAHMMTTEAANALLKVLEEPPGKSMLILISEKRELLLPTVVSRCSEVRFGALSAELTREILTEGHGVGEKDAAFLASFSEGSPGKALEMLQDGAPERKAVLVDLLKKISESENAACLNWDTEKKDILIEDVELLIMFFRDLVMATEGMETLVLDKDMMAEGVYEAFRHYSMDKVQNIVEDLIVLKRALMGNVNPKLVAQALPAFLK